MTRQYHWRVALKKLVPAVGVLCLLSWAASAIPKEVDEGVEVTLGPEWKPAFSAYARKLSLLAFVREGDTISDAKDDLSIENAGSKGLMKFPPEKTLNNILAHREKICPGATTEVKVIEKNESSILYEWQTKPCTGWPEQHEITRFILGTHYWFFLHYDGRGHDPAPDIRAQVIKSFSAAIVDSAPSALVPSPVSENVDEVVPFEIGKVEAAVKPAMEIKDCHVTEATAGRIECKRPRGTGEGGESVTAVLEEQGGRTRVQISTGKGFFGRLAKESWSNRVYEEMVRILLQGQSSN